MPAPVRIEGSAQGDPRFAVLGRLIGQTRYDALGRMTHLWGWCTERGVTEVPIFFLAGMFEDVDGDTLATGIVSAELGAWLECDQADCHPKGCRHVYMAGGKDRLGWLQERRDASAAGGKARAANAARSAGGRFESPAKHQPPPGEHLVLATSQTSSPNQRSGSGSGSGSGSKRKDHLLVLSGKAPPPVSDFDLAEGTDAGVPRVPAAKKRKRPRLAMAEDERAVVTTVLEKLTERSSVAFRATTDEHAAFVLARLRDGHSETQLRLVIWHQANEWETDEKMRKYLRPSTLFNRSKFAEYLAQAEAAWAESEPGKKRNGAGADPPAVSEFVTNLLRGSS